jgi:hypothetical protein
MLEVHNWFEQGLWAAIAARVGCEMPDPSQIATAEGVSQIPEHPVALHSLTPVAAFAGTLCRVRATFAAC